MDSEEYLKSLGISPTELIDSKSDGGTITRISIKDILDKYTKNKSENLSAIMYEFFNFICDTHPLMVHHGDSINLHQIERAIVEFKYREKNKS